MTNKNPKISIIIPVFNAEDTVEKTLKSVFLQDHKNIEVIVVDGLSSDESLNIIQSFSDISIILSEKDTGVYDAMNKGVDLATGDWLYFLGADDELHDGQVISKVFESIPEGCQLIYGNVQNIDRQSKRVPAIHLGKYDGGLLFKNTLHHQGTFYHKSIFLNHSYDTSRRILADYELNLILFRERIKAHYISLTIAKCQAAGISKDFVKKLYKEELAIKKKQLSPTQYLIQIPWVWMKYLYKNI